MRTALLTLAHPSCLPGYLTIPLSPPSAQDVAIVDLRNVDAMRFTDYFVLATGSLPSLSLVVLHMKCMEGSGVNASLALPVHHCPGGVGSCCQAS